ncbi:hypothetical protein QQ045_004851 [Rhodiola kirilowii]
MDETWKLSKGRSRSTSRSSTSKNKQQQQQYDQQEPHLLKSYSQRPSTSNRSPPSLPKSFSQRSSSKSRSSAKQASSSRYGYADSSDLMMGSESEKGSSSSSSIGKKCGTMAREQKARFYIIRRCVAMLVCWHKHVDDS